MNQELATIENAIVKALEEWNGWPSADYLVMTVTRRLKCADVAVTNGLRSLCQRQIVTYHKHNGMTVFRLE